MERIAPSARLEAEITALLTAGFVDGEQLSELGRLGARLVLQRGVEDEVASFLHRARYERTGWATGSRNGVRPKTVQTAEGPVSVAMPQVRGLRALRLHPPVRTCAARCAPARSKPWSLAPTCAASRIGTSRAWLLKRAWGRSRSPA